MSQPVRNNGWPDCQSVRRYDVFGGGTFVPRYQTKFHALAFGQGFKTISTNFTIVHEYISPIFTRNEAEAFAFVEPLNGSVVPLGLISSSLITSQSRRSEKWMPDRYWLAL